MSVWLSGYSLVLFVLLWLGISGYVIVTRALFDVRNLSFYTGRRVLERRLARLGSGEAALAGLPRRTLAGIAANASTDPALARLAARRLLEGRFDRVIRHARAHRNEVEKWRRISALRILAVAGWHIAGPLLRDALEDPDPDVANAAVTILGAGGRPEQAELLVDALRRNVVSRARVAAQLDAFPTPIFGLLTPLLDHSDPAVRQWGATLVARCDDAAVDVELAALVIDPDPQVRAAALKGMTRRRSPLATPAAMSALDDRVWFVRVHAARALGRLGHAELASDVVSLLGDPHWWVRTAAKDALEAMGDDATPNVVTALGSNDEFVRNSAAEVLQNTGVVDKLIARLTEAPDDERTARAIQSVFAAGGPALSEAAVLRSTPRAAARVRELQALAATSTG